MYLEAANAKREAIKKAIAAHFKQAVADAARGRRGIWPLAKWAKISLDMTGAFDRIVPARLLHNMRERTTPDWIVKWVGSFISNRTTTLWPPGSNN